MSLDLLSLTLPVRALGHRDLPPVGRAMQSVLLSAAQKAAQVANISLPDLHTGSELRPFTASDLAGHNRYGRVLPHRTYAIRLTSLTAPLSSALLKAATEGDLRLGETLVLTNAEFMLVSDIAFPREAITTRYRDLALACQPSERKEASEIRLWLASPTTFKRDDKQMPFPLPDLLFGSLLRKWNAFCPPALVLPDGPVGITEYAAKYVAISRYDLQTIPVRGKEAGVAIGAMGHVSYADLGGDLNMHAALHLLASFAPYAGVGARTTTGLGQCFTES